MSWEQYWYGDPLMVLHYRKAERLRQERADSAAWLQGAYVYDAVLRAAPVLRPFAKKGTKPMPYLEKPFGFKENVPQADMEQKAENERLKAQLFFRNWARNVGKNFSQ